MATVKYKSWERILKTLISWEKEIGLNYHCQIYILRERHSENFNTFEANEIGLNDRRQI